MSGTERLDRGILQRLHLDLHLIDAKSQTEKNRKNRASDAELTVSVCDMDVEYAIAAQCKKQRRMQRASHLMLAPGSAVFASTSGTTVLAQAAAAANGTQCFGLTMLAVVALPAALAHLFAVLAKSPAVALGPGT
jgi:hypothetical protein